MLRGSFYRDAFVLACIDFVVGWWQGGEVGMLREGAILTLAPLTNIPRLPDDAKLGLSWS